MAQSMVTLSEAIFFSTRSNSEKSMFNLQRTAPCRARQRRSSRIYAVQSLKRVPPGPFQWPLVGSLFSVRLPLHQYFADLAEKYGPIIYMKIGMVPFLVVNDAQTAEQVLRNHDAKFASRPRSELFRIFSFNFTDILFSSPGKEWRNMRRISNTHLFTNAMLNISAGFRLSELKSAVEDVRQLSRDKSPVNLTTVFEQLTSNSLCLTLFGKKGPMTNKIVDTINTITSQGLGVNVGELIPALDWLDLHGVNKKVSDCVETLKTLIQQQLEEHKQRKHEDGDKFVHGDFTDILISMPEDEISSSSLVPLLVDMLAAGLETTNGALVWTMAEVIHNPEVLCKAQEEIDAIVGTTRLVEEKDLQNLSYIQAIVKESLRLHPVAPLGLPHYNHEEVELAGYTVPAGCKVLINIWAIGRDKTCWSEPDKFQPERFLGSNMTLNGQHFQLIPFSSGRRVCVGYPLAMRTLPLLLAGMLQMFDWSPVDKLDLREGTRTFTYKLPSDLVAYASPRILL